MNITEFTFKLLLLFFPGIICSFIIDKFTIHNPRTPFTFLIRSFTFGILAYLSYSLFSGIEFNPVLNNEAMNNTLGSIFSQSADIKISTILYATLSGCIIAIFFTIADTYKWFNRVARYLKLTNKFGDLDVWGFVLNLEDTNWVTVRDHNNNLCFEGWVQAFSDTSKKAELFLRDVSVFDNLTGDPLYQVGALYISRDRHNISIENRSLSVSEEFKWEEEGNTSKKKKGEQNV